MHILLNFVYLLFCYGDVKRLRIKEAIKDKAYSHDFLNVALFQFTASENF